MITLEELTEFEKLIADATPGPWLYDSYSKCYNPTKYSENKEDFYVCQSPCSAGDTATTQGAKDLDFIAASRTMAPRLVSEVKRLKRIIAKELTENDELGAEFTYVLALKDEVKRLRKSNELLKAAYDLIAPDESELSDYKAAVEVMSYWLRKISTSEYINVRDDKNNLIGSLDQEDMANKALESDVVKKVLEK